MAFTHGVYVHEADTAITSPVTSYSGLPFVIGTSPSGTADSPQLIYTYEEAVKAFGYSDDWSTHTLCEFMYSHFVLYGQSPVVLVKASANTKSAIIGGYNSSAGKKTGLELVSEVFHKYRLIPGIILAPKWSREPEVAAVMKAKAESLSEVFRCIALCDAPGDKYTEIPSWKTSKNYTSGRQLLCWPKVKLGDKVYHMSTHICGVINRTDAGRDDVPYKSPSNEPLQAEGTVNDSGDEVIMTLGEANYLNSQGIVTAINWTGGWRVWGNRTCAYPASSDPKEVFISVRRMFDYIGNTFINTFWQKADQPLTVRLIREIVSSYNLYLNGLTAREMILGGRIEFREDENGLTDLMSGIIRFHVYVTPPEPSETIEGILEYDPQYLSALYSAVRS